MSWGTEVESHEAKRDRLLLAWSNAKEQLQRIKDEEMALRKECAAFLFPNPKEGTNRVELGAGYSAKLIQKLNYKTIGTIDEVITVEDEIERLGNEGPFLADRLLKWSVEVVPGEYKKLDIENNPAHKRARDLINSIIEIVPGSPTLTIEAPKDKK